MCLNQATHELDHGAIKPGVEDKEELKLAIVLMGSWAESDLPQAAWAIAWLDL